MTGHVETLLQAIAREPAGRISSLAILPEHEARKVLVEEVGGTLVTVVEGWKALGQAEPAERTEGGTTVLLQIAVGGGGEQKTIGFTVDEVVDMLAVDAEALEPRQALPGLDPKLVRAVGRRRDQLFVVLDTDALLGPVLTI